MSHHDLPRIHFLGEFQANVPTANNDDIASAFPGQQFVDVAQVRLNTFGMNDADFATWLRQIASPFGIRAGWNLYGNGFCDVPNSTVQSVHTKTGGLTTNASVDPFVGATVGFPQGAVMVDLDPEGTLGTQIFCSEFRLSLGPSMRILAGPVRFCSRDIGRRNLHVAGFAGFAASWFATVPPDQFSIVAGSSPVLATAREAQDLGKGLFFAFCTYYLSPRISQSQLAIDFANGVSTRNPAIGRWIGTVGVWDPAEMRTVATARRLLPSAVLQHDHQPFQLNPALATVHRDRTEITVDLLSTFPEADETLQKVQVGTIRLGVVTNPGGTEQLVDLGEIAYDRGAYERQSGLIDVSYSPDQQVAIDDGVLVLYQQDTGARMLTETRWTAFSDDRCVYLQEGEIRDFTLRLFDKGDAATTAADVRVAQYDTTNRIITPVSPTSGIVSHDDELHLPAGGTATFAVTAQRPGVCVLALLPPDEDDQSLDYFVNIRVLPRDDYDAIPDSALTFAFLYDEVLRYYHLLCPAMSEQFPLNNAFRVKLKAAEIKRRISTSLWDTVAYMPITRDLSDGKRKLLDRWCDLAIGSDGPPLNQPAERVAPELTVSAPTRPTMHIGILVFDGVECLDFEGPLGVLGWAARVSGASVKFRILSKDGQPVQDHLLRRSIAVDGASSAEERFDLLLVPGGDLQQFIGDAELVAEILRLGNSSELLASVCTGAFLVAQTGLAKGKKMSTHWQFRDEFQRRFPQISLLENVRFVNDVKLWSSAGISAGIDMTFAIVRSAFGDSVARSVQKFLEYRPEPPFPW